ncbi:MAG: hypothetical protein PHE58_06365 [Candidatus Omnitrophica bacterium]|nr:hypothetical protein [Candidatus Omnitrophota bacterium]
MRSEFFIALCVFFLCSVPAVIHAEQSSQKKLAPKHTNFYIKMVVVKGAKSIPPDIIRHITSPCENKWVDERDIVSITVALYQAYENNIPSIRPEITHTIENKILRIVIREVNK